MRWAHVWIPRASALAVAIAGGVAAGVALAQGTVAGTRPACVEARGEARMQAYGFDHVVSIRNGCDRPVRCRVSTDVNPNPTSLDVLPGQMRETVTWRGSPASVFAPRADCDLAR